MGVDFRGKGYVRRVRIGKRTIKEGEAVAVWDAYGRHEQIVGPCLIRLWWSTIRFLEHHSAGSEAYLRVQNRDGTIKHLRGPVAMFENPVYHSSVKVENAISIPDASSYIVVNRFVEGAKEATQRVIAGPFVFFPDPSDSVLIFAWTENGLGLLSGGGHVVTLRKTAAQKLKCNVRDSLGHSAEVTLELRVRITSLEPALHVADPVAECHGVTQAAVLQTLSKARFADPGASLDHAVRSAIASNELTEFLTSKLQQRASCEFLGLTVLGITPSPELDRICRKEDELAEAKMAEKLAMMSLEAASARQDREHALALAKEQHLLRLSAERECGARSCDDYQDKRRLAYFKELRALGIDMTKYVCSVGDNMDRHRGASPLPASGECLRL